MKRYLGDGVYADYDGFRVVLTTEDGISESNRIYLEPQVWNALRDYVIGLREGEADDDGP